MFKTQLNCAPYVAPSDLKEIQHLVRAFAKKSRDFLKVLYIQQSVLLTGKFALMFHQGISHQLL